MDNGSGSTLPVPAGGSTVRVGHRRQMVNGLQAGCPWALLPSCFGPWKTVYDYFRRWSLQLSQVISLQSGNVASTDGCDAIGLVDSQTIKTQHMANRL